MMALDGGDGASELEAVLPTERSRLIRLCAGLTGDVEAAEDLAQETLLEAWRHVHHLRADEGYARWLSAIARNVCRRWERRRGRELGQRLPSPHEGAPVLLSPSEAAEGFDLEVDLERTELARLLDRALALLPPLTRVALVEKYINDMPQAEIAARLGVSEGAVEVRLHRGKLALRRVLATEFAQETLAYGLAIAAPSAWQQTPIWCPYCGQQRLCGRFASDGTDFWLRCPACFPEPHATLAHGAYAAAFGPVTGLKRAFARLLHQGHAYYRQALATRVAPCWNCGRPSAVHLVHADEGRPAHGDVPGVSITCALCGPTSNCALSVLSLALPEGRRFWRAHPRIRLLPLREIEVGGRRAIVTSFQSVSERSQFDVISARDTFEVIRIAGTPRT
jgi:RNA polymerase sigma-70 factor (ECF subfamily)